jgi:hypothetical protein
MTKPVDPVVQALNEKIDKLKRISFVNRQEAIYEWIRAGEVTLEDYKKYMVPFLKG